MKLSIVGAGPGHPELITLRAIKVLGQASVILYDALANKSLLQYGHKEAERVYVGKRLGKHSISQEEINRIIKENLLQGKHVVRLKGGDPIIFGRGFEELEMAKELQAETEVVPGISSCVAVPSSCGIPVTRRGQSESFWVLTGHTKNGGIPADMHLAAQSNATIVILMGLSKIVEIQDIFMTHDKGHLPVAVIQNGTTPEEKCVLGEVHNIVSKIIENGLSNPAIIVIGETVKNSPSYVQTYLEKQKLFQETL